MSMDRYRLDGKRALVTGASKGIGLGIARGLVDAGAELIVNARGQQDLEAARVELSANGGRVATARYDLAEIDGIADWYAELVRQQGPIDIVVNNAGVNRRGPTETSPPEDWDAVLDVNLTAVFSLSQAFARERIQSNTAGNIINIASLMSFAVRPTVAPYTASKGGIAQLTRSFAVEWASREIRANAIAPGYIKTPMSESLSADPEFDKWIKARTPQGRWGLPADIAPLAVFLASDAASYITGQVIYADGGFTASM